jgi:hypothetical protein
MFNTSRSSPGFRLIEANLAGESQARKALCEAQD